jgi:hypothetical protein
MFFEYLSIMLGLISSFNEMFSSYIKEE